MEYFIQIEDEEPFQTEYQYTVGEVVTFNSNKPCKCMEVEVIGDRTIYHFVNPIFRWPTMEEYKKGLVIR